MKQLTAKDILNSELKSKQITIPEWGGVVFIREPTAYERGEYEILVTNASNDDEILKEIRGICAAKCIADAKGNRLFTDDQINDLHKLSANALDRIIDAYREIALLEETDIIKAAKN